MRPRTLALACLWFVAASFALTCSPVFAAVADAGVNDGTEPARSGAWALFWIWVADNPEAFLGALAAVGTALLAAVNVGISKVRKRWPNVGDALASGLMYLPWVWNSVGKALANRQLRKRGLAELPYQAPAPSKRPPPMPVDDRREPPEDPPGGAGVDLRAPRVPSGGGLGGPGSARVVVGRWGVVALVLALASGCTIRDLVRAADGASVAGEAARPVLRELCTEPMAELVIVLRAAKEKADEKTADAARAEAAELAKDCDPAIGAQRLLLKLHAALRAGIVALQAGLPAPTMPQLVIEAGQAAVKLGQALAALKDRS